MAEGQDASDRQRFEAINWCFTMHDCHIADVPTCDWAISLSKICSCYTFSKYITRLITRIKLYHTCKKPAYTMQNFKYSNIFLPNINFMLRPTPSIDNMHNRKMQPVYKFMHTGTIHWSFNIDTHSWDLAKSRILFLLIIKFEMTTQAVRSHHYVIIGANLSKPHTDGSRLATTIFKCLEI